MSKLEELADEQRTKTSTFWGKLYEFLKIVVLRQQNKLEKKVLYTEPNDTSLISKYRKTCTIDLSSEPDISVNEISLNSIRIPHPLESFMRNDANNAALANIDVEGQLQDTPILLFIHGLGGQMSQFNLLMGLLSQCLEVIALDLPGFGDSEVEFNGDKKRISTLTEDEERAISQSVSQLSWSDFSTDNIVKIVKQFTKQVIPKNKKVLLVGHSMGTHLCIKLAKTLPKSKVEGMILLSPPALKDETVKHKGGLILMLRIFTYFPFLFNFFRVWDRLEGLDSKSVRRQFSKTPVINLYNKVRQFRWNLDINTKVVLGYISGFKAATRSDLIHAVGNLHDDPKNRITYQKTLLIGGTGDQVTSINIVTDINDFLRDTFGREVSKTFQINGAGHSLLLTKPEFVSGLILDHIEKHFPERLHLSPAWVLKLKAEISGDKWGLKNKLKWQKVQPISYTLINGKTHEVSPLLALKTLREGDDVHSPAILEEIFYGDKIVDTAPEGKLIAIVDISSDIPPYDPQSFHHIKYYKFPTVSKVVPDQIAIRRFVQLVDEIFLGNSQKNPLVAVHCHYGFNRTGFLICCYLIERLGWGIAEAVEAFKVAREPGIRHAHFIDALYVRYES